MISSFTIFRIHEEVWYMVIYIDLIMISFAFFLISFALYKEQTIDLKDHHNYYLPFYFQEQLTDFEAIFLGNII